jgi:NAD(P) transhydrogenase alpha subunit
VMSEGFQQAQKELYARMVPTADIVVTTAQIPGKPAPKLISAAMVRSMKPGSVIMDLASQQGGNCELTVKDRIVTDEQSGVVIVGLTNLAATMPAQASELYAANVGHLLAHVKGAAELDKALASPDEIVEAVRVTYAGSVTYQPPKAPAAAPPSAPVAAKPAPKPAPVAKPTSPVVQWITFALTLLTIGLTSLGIGAYAEPGMVQHLLAFALSVVVGYFLVWSVDPALHTPLMSVTNAVSGIIVLGALLQLGASSYFAELCAFLGVFCAGCNVFGGFLVTQRMLKMFRR